MVLQRGTCISVSTMMLSESAQSTSGFSCSLYLCPFPLIPLWEIPLSEENHSPSHESPRKALKQALRQSRALTHSLLSGDSDPSITRQAGHCHGARPHSHGITDIPGGLPEPQGQWQPLCHTGFPMSSLCEGVCRTQGSPEVVTGAQKWRKGDCRLILKEGKARTPSWGSRAA